MGEILRSVSRETEGLGFWFWDAFHVKRVGGELSLECERFWKEMLDSFQKVARK